MKTLSVLLSIACFLISGMQIVKADKPNPTPVINETTTDKPDSVEIARIQSITYKHADEMPSYPGGEKKMKKEINRNIYYPTEAANNGWSAWVKVQFLVKRDGSIDSISVAKPLYQVLDNEAIKAVSLLSKPFNPGKVKGIPVDVWYEVLIPFILQ